MDGRRRRRKLPQLGRGIQKHFRRAQAGRRRIRQKTGGKEQLSQGNKRLNSNRLRWSKISCATQLAFKISQQSATAGKSMNIANGAACMVRCVCYFESAARDLSAGCTLNLPVGAGFSWQIAYIILPRVCETETATDSDFELVWHDNLDFPPCRETGSLCMRIWSHLYNFLAPEALGLNSLAKLLSWKLRIHIC